jgi:hypothetical protein
MFMKYSAVRRLRSSGGALLFAMLLTPESILSRGRYQVVLNMDSSLAVRSLSGTPLVPGNLEADERLVTRFSVADR